MPVLEQHLCAYRIGDPHGRFPIFSGKGAAREAGRWHTKGHDPIYMSEHYSTAMLEKLAHYNGDLPPNQHFIKIDIPAGTSYEVVTKDSLPAWTDLAIAQAFGSRWFSEGRSALLIVPSYVARMENNVVLNPRHPDAKAARPGLETPVWWDERLFTR